MLKLKRFLSLGYVLASALFLASAGSAAAVEPLTDLSLSVGWRQDEIKTNFTNSDYTRSHFKIKDINIWQIGLDGSYGLPDCFCGCEAGWLNQLYFTGSAYWGWVTDGKVHHNDGGSSGSGSGSGGSGHRKIHNGNTYDYSIGLGWLYPFGCDCEYGIGPTVGYAWDKIRVKSRNGHDSSGSSDTSGLIGVVPVYDSYGSSSFGLKNLRYEGPWLGFDAAYALCGWRVDFGYEYHWPRLDHSGHFSSDSSSSGSHKNRGRTGSGNLVRLDGRYNWCDCMDIIVGFKWENFRTKNRGFNGGSGSGSSSGSGSNSGGHTQWDTVGISAGVAYNF